ncbi:hypothetical protein H6784_00885 [Candidatus Nomurabacteria bacterium]|nr:hypothetical protein [Candidatus Kaiserbacteria bacterium]MCB9813947.1 hypothetical protein [Candidatus Nomurabacteria bacterium]
MSFFGLKISSDRYGVVIDIGSGSVLASIVHSNSKLANPTIVWSHREHAPLRNIDSLEQSSKAVLTSLVNVSMMLDAEGRKVLYDYDSSAKLTELQCAISAPWSYTVTKTINYNQENDFTITENLMGDLMIAVQEKITHELNENEEVNNLGLEVIVQSTMEILSNGYRVKNPEGERAKQFSLSYASAVAQKYLVNAIDEMWSKLFVGTINKKLSFIMVLYNITREILPNSYDVCLVDITYEATEIGIVRDGSLQYCTHTPFGIFSLTREISAITGVPLHEAFGYLHSDTPYSFMKALTESKKMEVEKVFDAYIEKVSNLFHETGDDLSIPKKISLHTDLNSEPIFLDLIEKAAKRNLKTNPLITPISREIVRKFYAPTTNTSPINIPTDTALLLSAQFFHKPNPEQTYEYK